MLKYPTYMAVETLTIALVTEDGQSFEDLGIEERKEGQVIIKCRAAEPMRDGAPCEWNKMGSDGYPFCASATEIMRLRDENAKLRELVQNLRRVIPADVVGVVIGANTDHPSYYKFDKAFRELEIEVFDE